MKIDMNNIYNFYVNICLYALFFINTLLTFFVVFIIIKYCHDKCCNKCETLDNVPLNRSYKNRRYSYVTIPETQPIINQIDTIVNYN